MARQYYKDSTTGQMKPLGVKVEDTLPVGTEVDYDGTDIPEGWEEVDDKVTLFTSASGDNGAITLSDNIDNYDYIEIYYSNDNTNTPRLNYQKIDLSVSKRASLYAWSCDSGHGIYVSIRDIILSRTSLQTLDNERYARGIYDSSGWTKANENRLYIYKVIGYKEV